SSTRSVQRAGLPLRIAIGPTPLAIVVLSPASAPQPFGGSIDRPDIEGRPSPRRRPESPIAVLRPLVGSMDGGQPGSTAPIRSEEHRDGSLPPAHLGEPAGDRRYPPRGRSQPTRCRRPRPAVRGRPRPQAPRGPPRCARGRPPRLPDRSRCRGLGAAGPPRAGQTAPPRRRGPRRLPPELDL